MPSLPRTIIAVRQAGRAHAGTVFVLGTMAFAGSVLIDDIRTGAAVILSLLP